MELYIVEVITFQALFLVVYELLLKKETFFNSNRAYLLITPLLAFLLPYVEIDVFKTTVYDPSIVQLPAVILGKEPNTIMASQTQTWSIWGMLWLVGVLIALSHLIFKGYALYKVALHAKAKIRYGKQCLIVPNSQVAFSFLNYVFIGEDIKKNDLEHIITHEYVHVKEYHSIDLLVFEIFRVVMWFNPLLYIYQKNISTVHEYIADSKTAKTSKNTYCENLLNTAFKTSHFSFTNTFFNHSLIKKRILMLHKNSNPTFKLKYLAIIPLLVGMLLYTSCESEREPSTSSDISSKIADLEAAIDNGEALSDDEIQDLIMLKGKLNKLQDNQILPPPPPPPSPSYSNAEDVPYSAIDKAPTFSTCSGNTEELKACTSSTITNHVVSNFEKDILKDSDVSGIVRIYVAFKIDKDGRATAIKARAPVKRLATEAKRVVASLPQMIPGEHNGKKVNVLYSLPIVFDTNG